MLASRDLPNQISFRRESIDRSLHRLRFRGDLAFAVMLGCMSLGLCKPLRAADVRPIAADDIDGPVERQALGLDDLSGRVDCPSRPLICAVRFRVVDGFEASSRFVVDAAEIQGSPPLCSVIVDYPSVKMQALGIIIPGQRMNETGPSHVNVSIGTGGQGSFFTYLKSEIRDNSVLPRDAEVQSVFGIKVFQKNEITYNPRFTHPGIYQNKPSSNWLIFGRDVAFRRSEPDGMDPQVWPVREQECLPHDLFLLKQKFFLFQGDFGLKFASICLSGRCFGLYVHHPSLAVRQVSLNSEDARLHGQNDQRQQISYFDRPEAVWLWFPVGVAGCCVSALIGWNMMKWTDRYRERPPYQKGDH